MRFLKILFIIYCSLILIGLSYALIEETGAKTYVPLYAKILIALMYLLGIANIVYHIKSFRFYRREEKRNLDKKLAKLLWIGTLSFSAFLLFLVCVAIYNNSSKYLEHRYTSEDVFFISLMVGPALVGFLEVSMLKKRIKRLKMTRTAKDEIEDIGNSI